MNINGQGHSLTSVRGHSYSTFSNFFSLETAGPIEAKILCGASMGSDWFGLISVLRPFDTF